MNDDTNANTNGTAQPQPGPQTARVTVPPPGFAPAPSAMPVPPRPPKPDVPREPLPWLVRLLGGCLVLFALGAVLCGLAGAFAFLVVNNSATASGTQSGTLAVTGSPTIAISASAGALSVLPSPDGKMHYTLEERVRSITAETARRALGQSAVSATQGGDVVTVTLQPQGFGHFDALIERNVSLIVQVPSQVPLRLSMDAGTLIVRGLTLTGDSTITGSVGTVTLDGVTIAGSLTLHHTGGSANLTCTLAPHARFSADITAGSLSLGLPVDTSAALDARVTAGSVSVDGWPTVQVTRNGSQAAAAGELTPNPTGAIQITGTAGSVNIYALTR